VHNVNLMIIETDKYDNQFWVSFIKSILILVRTKCGSRGNVIHQGPNLCLTATLEITLKTHVMALNVY